MTKTKSTKRALLLSALSLLMCVSMLIGSTFAWFTDSVTSGNNKIVAGNLDVALYHTNGTDTDEEVTDTTKLFDEVALWEPGAMVWEKLTVKNLGSLALKYSLTVNVSDISVVDGKSLADVLKVAVMTEQPTRDSIKTATTQSLETFVLNGEGVLAAKTGEDKFYVAIYWAPTADDNNYNIAGEQLYATLGVNLLATQATVEKDSFDEKYDADASFDDVIFANGGTYVMEDDRDEGITISSGATVVINGNGNEINNGAAGLINEGNATVNEVVMNAGSASNYSNITRGEDAKTTYNDVTLNSAGGGVGAVDGAEVIFNSGSVEVNTTSTSGRYLFYAEGEGTVITINDGNFADFTKTSQNQKRAYIYAGAGTTVYVNGGTFGKASTRNGYTAGILGSGTVVITGGSFGFDPSNWVKNGYKTLKIDGVYYVVPNDLVAADLYIANAEQLFAFAADVNGGNSYSGKIVAMIADIDLNNAAWTPIGQTGATEFKGTFNGQGNTIKNLYIDSSLQTDGDYSSGLFGWIESHGQDITIKNVNVDGATVIGHHNVAVIAGYMEGDSVVENCNVTNATVKNTHANDDACGDKTGLIAGYVAGEVTVKDCAVSASTVQGSRDAGQLIGASYAVPVNCTATDVTVSASGDCTGANVQNDLVGRKLGSAWN